MFSPLIPPLLEIYGTKAELAEQLGCDVRTLTEYSSKPKASAKRPRPKKPKKRRTASGALQTRAGSLFAKHYPFPLPKYQLLLRNRLSAVKSLAGSDDLLAAIVLIEGIVADALPERAWHAAGLKNLKYMACQARALLRGNNADFGTDDDARVLLARGRAALEEGREIIAQALRASNNHPDQKLLRELDAWLFLNWTVAIALRLPSDGTAAPEDDRTTLVACNAVERFKTALKEVSHEFRIAYNGLDVASRSRAPDADLAIFYTRLLYFDRQFTDFNYSPGEVLAIASNPDLAYFRERFKSNPAAFNPQPSKE